MESTPYFPYPYRVSNEPPSHIQNDLDAYQRPLQTFVSPSIHYERNLSGHHQNYNMHHPPSRYGLMHARIDEEEGEICPKHPSESNGHEFLPSTAYLFEVPNHQSFLPNNAPNYPLHNFIPARFNGRNSVCEEARRKSDSDGIVKKISKPRTNSDSNILPHKDKSFSETIIKDHRRSSKTKIEPNKDASINKKPLKKKKQDARNNNQNNNKKSASITSATKKTICKFWMEGLCKKGDDCLFSHDGKPHKTRNEVMKEEICKFYMMGSCMKGEECPYSHDLQKVPCKYFHAKGYCSAREACRFSHQPIDEEEKAKIIKEFIEQNERVEVTSVTTVASSVIKDVGAVLFSDPFLNPYASPF